jgi:hypothetical protein
MAADRRVLPPKLGKDYTSFYQLGQPVRGDTPTGVKGTNVIP